MSTEALILISGLIVLAAFIAFVRRARRCQEPGCSEKAIGERAGRLLCNRHYHDFRGKYPSAGE